MHHAHLACAWHWSIDHTGLRVGRAHDYGTRYTYTVIVQPGITDGMGATLEVPLPIPSLTQRPKVTEVIHHLGSARGSVLLVLV